MFCNLYGRLGVDVLVLYGRFKEKIQVLYGRFGVDKEGLEWMFCNLYGVDSEYILGKSAFNVSTVQCFAKY